MRELETEIGKLQRHLKEAEERNRLLSLENKQLRKSLEMKSNDLETMKKNEQRVGQDIATGILHAVFTPGQVKKLMAPGGNCKRIKWSADDISSAIALRSLSGKTYKYLREVKQLPLPCESTLRNWATSFDTKPGVLKDVLKIMQSKGEDLSTADKITVLTFDEIYISNILDLERREQKIYGPHKTCQFVMARGLFSKWKQPIYYQYSQAMTKDILMNIITALHKIYYTVVAVTSDLGPTNIALWNELNIGVRLSKSQQGMNEESSEKKYFFEHPADKSLTIFVFADVPHLIKLLRNNFIDYGFLVGGKMLNKRILEELVALNSKDLKIAFNLSEKHLDAKGHQRQTVKLAAQVFSRRNALAIEYCGKKGFFSQNSYWQELSDVFLLINDWFDVLNSQSKFGSHSGSRAYGVELEHQNEVLGKMSQFISNMRVGKKSTLLPFQKGILLTNASLKKLLLYIKEKYSSDLFIPEYIITRRLCQDVLENFFSYLRAMGAANDHPSPVEVQHRLKWYILGKHSAQCISTGENTEGDSSAVPFMAMQDIHCTDSCELDSIKDFNDDDDDDVEVALLIHNEKLHTSEVEDINNRTQEEEEDKENKGDLGQYS